MTQGYGGRRPPPRPREGWTGLNANDKVPVIEASLDRTPREGCAGLLGRKQRHWHLGGF